MSEKMLTVAAIQSAPVFLNLNESVAKARTLIEEAANAGAKVVGFAECWLTGYPVWLDFADGAARWGDEGATDLYQRLSNEAVVLGGGAYKALQGIADDTGTVISMGTHEKRGGTLTNTAMTFVPGAAEASIRRKLVPTYTERLVWGRGDGSTLKAAQTDHGPVSTLICWEHWIPQLRTVTHAETPAVHVSQWPVVSDPHLLASRHIAFEGRVPVIAAGSIMSKADILDGYKSGHHTKTGLAILESMKPDDKGLIHRGGSCIIQSDASFAHDQIWDEEQTVLAEVDLSLATRLNLTLDVNGHYNRPDLFELKVDRREQALTT